MIIAHMYDSMRIHQRTFTSNEELQDKLPAARMRASLPAGPGLYGDEPATLDLDVLGRPLGPCREIATTPS